MFERHWCMNVGLELPNLIGRFISASDYPIMPQKKLTLPAQKYTRAKHFLIERSNKPMSRLTSADGSHRAIKHCHSTMHNIHTSFSALTHTYTHIAFIQLATCGIFKPEFDVRWNAATYKNKYPHTRLPYHLAKHIWIKYCHLSLHDFKNRLFAASIGVSMVAGRKPMFHVEFRQKWSKYFRVQLRPVIRNQYLCPFFDHGIQIHTLMGYISNRSQYVYWCQLPNRQFPIFHILETILSQNSHVCPRIQQSPNKITISPNPSMRSIVID